MKVKVYQHHIDTAVRNNSHHCMIADAIRDQFERCKFIMVDLQSIRFTILEEATRYTYLTPGPAQVALLRFDQGEPVKPFRFSLRDPIKRKSGWRGVKGTKEHWKPKPGHKPTGKRAVQEREFGLRKFVK